MKKIIAILLSLVLLLSLCACGGASSASREVMKYVDSKYKQREYETKLTGDAQGLEVLLTMTFYYDDDLTMYSAVDNNTYIVVFDMENEEIDLSQYTETASAMSRFGYEDNGVDNQLFFTYSPKNKVFFAVHNGEDITSNYGGRSRSTSVATNSPETITDTSGVDNNNNDLTEYELKEIVATAIYDEIIRRQNIRPGSYPGRLNSRIDPSQCSFNISKIERGYRENYIVYGNGYLYDKYGKICDTYDDGSGYGDYNFTVTIPFEGDAKCEIN